MLGGVGRGLLVQAEDEQWDLVQVRSACVERFVSDTGMSPVGIDALIRMVGDCFARMKGSMPVEDLHAAFKAFHADVLTDVLIPEAEREAMKQFVLGIDDRLLSLAPDSRMVVDEDIFRVAFAGMDESASQSCLQSASEIAKRECVGASDVLAVVHQVAHQWHDDIARVVQVDKALLAMERRFFSDHVSVDVGVKSRQAEETHGLVLASARRHKWSLEEILIQVKPLSGIFGLTHDAVELVRALIFDYFDRVEGPAQALMASLDEIVEQIMALVEVDGTTKKSAIALCALMSIGAPIKIWGSLASCAVKDRPPSAIKLIKCQWAKLCYLASSFAKAPIGTIAQLLMVYREVEDLYARSMSNVKILSSFIGELRHALAGREGGVDPLVVPVTAQAIAPEVEQADFAAIMDDWLQVVQSGRHRFRQIRKAFLNRIDAFCDRYGKTNQEHASICQRFAYLALCEKRGRCGQPAYTAEFRSFGF